MAGRARASRPAPPTPTFPCVIGSCHNLVMKAGMACTDSSGGTRTAPLSATPEQNTRYIRGICVECGEAPQSAGRPRCGPCHAAMPVDLIEPELKRRGA